MQFFGNFNQSIIINSRRLVNEQHDIPMKFSFGFVYKFCKAMGLPHHASLTPWCSQKFIMGEFHRVSVRKGCLGLLSYYIIDMLPLSMYDRIDKITKISYYHLLQRLKSSKSARLTNYCRLDYCNSVLAGLPRLTVAPPQRMLNTTARIAKLHGVREPHHIGTIRVALAADETDN